MILKKFCLSFLRRFLDFEVDDDVRVDIATYEKIKGESLPPTSHTIKVVSVSKI